jgi:hypothetical protein
MEIELQDGISININKSGLVYFYQGNDIVGPFDIHEVDKLTFLLSHIVRPKLARIKGENT